MCYRMNAPLPHSRQKRLWTINICPKNRVCNTRHTTHGRTHKTHARPNVVLFCEQYIANQQRMHVRQELRRLVCMLLLLVEPYAAHRCNRIGSARPTKLSSTLSLRIDPIKRLRLGPALQR